MENKYDHQSKIIFAAIKQLLVPPAEAIGFRWGKDV